MRSEDNKQLPKKNNGLRDVIIGIVVSIAIFLILAVFVQVGSRIDQEYSTNQASEYGNWDGHIDRERESMESGLFLFPEDISSAKDSDYFYYCGIDYHSISQYLIYAAVTYPEDTYKKEVERIANTKCKVQLSASDAGDTVTNSVEYTKKLFVYPAYIAIYASNLSYEYALLDEENHRIIYVYLQMKDANGMIPDEYLPLEVLGKDMYENNNWDNPNICFFKDKHNDYRYYKDFLVN